jgi:hypothetical protein
MPGIDQGLEDAAALPTAGDADHDAVAEGRLQVGRDSVVVLDEVGLWQRLRCLPVRRQQPHKGHLQQILQTARHLA